MVTDDFLNNEVCVKFKRELSIKLFLNKNPIFVSDNYSMDDDPTTHNRKSIRLKGYDYSQAGAYFITTNIKNPYQALSRIVDDRIELSNLGKIVLNAWNGLPEHYCQVDLDEFIVMPDHIHGILFLREYRKPCPVSEIVRNFKTYSAKEINAITGQTGNSFWQRNYFEHVIRDDMDLNRIRQYIQENPLKWKDGKGDISPLSYYK